MTVARSEDRPRSAVELDGPSPAVARRAVADVSESVGLAPSVAEGLILAVSEVVANAHQHGAPPVRVVIQPLPDRMVVEVTDAGPGVGDRYLGVLPTIPRPDAASGRGRWLAQQHCAEVVEFVGSSGFTVRLTGGAAAR